MTFALYEINLMFFAGIGFVINCVLLFLFVKNRKAYFEPIKEAVPYYYNPEDEILYTKPVSSTPVQEDSAVKVSSPLYPSQQTSFSTTRVEDVEIEKELDKVFMEYEEKEKKKKVKRKKEKKKKVKRR